MLCPLEGVALARKFTGEVTVEPSSGEQTLTPGPVGAPHDDVAVPVPVSDAVCGLPEAESVMLTAPTRVPAWFGEKVTFIKQLAPAAKLLGQLLV